MKNSLALPFLILLLANAALAQPPAVKEIYQDFRNKRPLSEHFRLHGGADPAAAMKAENEGLRIKTEAVHGPHHMQEVVANFTPIVGDFEVTATYEILSAQKPEKGYGAGVNLTISIPTEPRKVAKLCRVFHPKNGSIYLPETFPKYQSKPQKTESMSGQLRMARFGQSLHYLVSDGPGQEFREIWKIDYGADDVTYLAFQVQDGGQPRNLVDARLIDLRVRIGKLDPAKSTAAAPLDAPAPLDPVPAVAPRTDTPRAATPDRIATPDRAFPGWIVGMIIAFAVSLLLFVLAIVAFLLTRRRKPAADDVPTVDPQDEPERPAAPTVVTCAACGKKLKVKAQSAGKRVKCPGCGKAVAVPVAN